MSARLRAEQLKVEQFSNGELHYDLWYPGPGVGNPTHLQIGMMHVRATDGIRVSYDFERDGWVIEQGGVWSWSEDDPKPHDEDWQEVAFVRSWARDIRCDKRYQKINRLLVEALEHIDNDDLERRITNAADFDSREHE